MADFPLVHTQLVPPRVKTLLNRTRLHSLGQAILSHRLTTIIAPAGYGKSVWVSSLSDDAGWPLTAWLILDRHDTEPSFLLYNLIHAIKKVQPRFGSESLRTMNSLEDVARDWLIAVSSLVGEIPKEDEIVLVLDDIYLITGNPAICDILAYLIHWLPANIHLVLISRNSLPLNLHREHLSGELLEIGSEHLLFSAEETGELLSLLGLDLAVTDIVSISQFTEGWPVGIRLLAMYLKQSGGDLKKTLPNLKRQDAHLYSYLGHELLDHLTGELRDFLLDSSLLPYLEPGLCNAALQHNDSDIKIKRLHSLGMLSRIEAETTVWRLHHLTGEFLAHEISRLRRPEHVVSIRHRAAAFLEQQGDINRALEQVTAFEDWSAAASLIRTYGDQYFVRKGRLDALNSWIGRLPDNYVSQDHRLLHFKGICSLHIDPEKALAILSEAVDLAKRNDDTREQIRSLMAILAVHTLANDAKKLRETAGRIPVAASLLRDSWSRGVLLVAALGRAVSEDRLKRGVWLGRLLSRFKLDPEWQMYYLLLSGIIQYRLGDMVQAMQFVEKALALPFVRDSDRWTGTAYEVISGIYCDTGNSQKTIEISQELLRLGHKYNIPHQTAYGHRRLARIYLRQGSIAEARREYESSRHWWFKAGNVLMTYITDLEIIFARAIAGENPIDLLKEVSNPLNIILDNPAGQGYRDYALSLAGVIAREAGDLAQAQQWLEESVNNSANKGAKQMLAGTLVHLARLHLLKDEEKLADDCLHKAFGIMETAQLDVFWDWHPETVFSLCRHALLKNIHPVWAAHLMRRWFSQRTCKEAVSLLVHSDQSVRSHITGLVREVVEKTGTPVIHVSCFGVFRVFVNGTEISPSQWKTKKAENLFKFLIINRGQHPKERVIEAIWPESEPQLGNASLRMALTHVRKALNLNQHPDDSLILKRGMIYFNPQIELYGDYELFTEIAQGISEKDDSGQETLNLIEQAVKLYRGDFLPDNLYDDWTANLRKQLYRLYLQVLVKQADACRRRGKLDAAIKAGRRCLELEPADELLNRMAMELLWQSGQKHQALSLYNDLAAFLAREFDTTPSAETIALYEKIRCS
ncbi:MAG: hypothetical protein CVU89_01810 [Firmicutes bacterium HGW-Firmicutes-14]|nr:MAG: hypothetical protein CVU89_01810 [Firmicutes bacterium HGW-Firmicutes-14]